MIYCVFVADGKDCTHQVTAENPHTSTAAVDRGWTVMARMCREQLRIIPQQCVCVN